MQDVATRTDVTKPAQEPLDGEIDPIRYVARLWQYRWLVLGVTLVFGAAGLAAGLLSSPAYEASVRLVVTPPRAGAGDAAPLVSLAPFRALFENQTLAATVIRELKLDGPPLNMSPQAFVARSLTIDTIRETNILVLKLRLADPELAAKAANRLADLGLELSRRLNQDETASIKVEVDHARATLDDADSRLTAFKQRVQIEAQRADVESELTQRRGVLPLLVEIQAETAKLAKGEAELARHKRTGEITRTLDEGQVLAEAAKGKPNSAAGLMAVRVTSEYVDNVYQYLDRQVSESRAKLSALERKKVELIDARKLDSTRLASLNRLYASEAELSRLQSEYELAKELYVGAAKRYEQFRLQEIGRSGQMQLLDRAIPPGGASRTTLRNTLLALVLGTVVGSIIALLAGAVREWERRRPAVAP